MAESFRIRPATLADAARLAELERSCFSDPWSDSAIREALGMPGALALVAELSDRIVSYCLSRRVSTSAEVLTIGTEGGARRLGIARRIMEELMDRLATEGVEEIWLEVRESNRGALQLYHAMGFRPAGMRRAYYRSPTEDALVLRVALSEGA